MRRPHELEELPASLDERRVERGDFSSLSVCADGGTTDTNLSKEGHRGAVAHDRLLSRPGGRRV
jgi:hypothetical protein